MGVFWILIPNLSARESRFMHLLEALLDWRVRTEILEVVVAPVDRVDAQRVVQLPKFVSIIQ